MKSSDHADSHLSTNFYGPRLLNVMEHAHTLPFILFSKTPIIEGTKIRLTGGNFRNVYKRWHLGNISCSEGGSVEISQSPPHDWNEIVASKKDQPFQHYTLLELNVIEPIPSQGRVELSIRGNLHFEAPQKAFMYLELKGSEDDRFRLVSERYEFYNETGRAVNLECRAKPFPLPDGTHTLTLFASDIFRNPVHSFEGTVQIIPHKGIEGLPEEIIFQPDQKSVRISDIRVTSSEPVRISLIEESNGWHVQSNYLFPANKNSLGHYFGDIHFHSEFSSDGDRTQEQAYQYARDILNLDVSSLTDHTPKRFWQETCATNDQFLEEGHFITLHAWEWSTDQGHANFYLRNLDVDATPEKYDHQIHPGEVEWPDNVVMIPHHTNIRAAELKSDGTPHWYEYQWQHRNPRIQAVEICQARGNFEADEKDSDWFIQTGNIGASVQDALDMGYRLGFVGGTDNHLGFPTRNHDFVDVDYVGMTGFIAPKRTRDAIWQSLNKRHTYATTGVPIVCTFTINDSIMGSTIAWNRKDPLTMYFEIFGTKAIEVIELISDRKILQSWQHDTDSFCWKGNLPFPSVSGSYYYLRLRQIDDHKAWTSPIWIDFDS
ncbi:MAG: CehA/McbA family metallohydrolase [Verrucomicrobiota bacterium]